MRRDDKHRVHAEQSQHSEDRLWVGVEGQEEAPNAQEFVSSLQKALHQQPLQCQNRSSLPNLNRSLIPTLSLQCLMGLRLPAPALVFHQWQGPPFLPLVYVQLHLVEPSFET